MKFTSADQRTVISERCTGLLLELLSIVWIQFLMAIYSIFVHFTVTIFPGRVHNWRDVTFISHIACESCSLKVSGNQRGIPAIQGNITADKSQYERMIMRIVSFFWLSFNISQITAGVSSVPTEPLLYIAHIHLVGQHIAHSTGHIDTQRKSSQKNITLNHKPYNNGLVCHYIKILEVNYN